VTLDIGMILGMIFGGSIIGIVCAWYYGKTHPLAILTDCPTGDGGRIYLVQNPEKKGAWFGQCSCCHMFFNHDPNTNGGKKTD
jgi:hypothetical protein